MTDARAIPVSIGSSSRSESLGSIVSWVSSASAVLVAGSARYFATLSGADAIRFATLAGALLGAEGAESGDNLITTACSDTLYDPELGRADASVSGPRTSTFEAPDRSA